MLLVLAVTGWGLRALEAPAWRALRAREPALQLGALEGSLGQGVTVGLLGGFRALLADLLWIRTNIVWEQRDLPATQTLIKLVTAVDPRPLYFWLNGARMVAYDMPNWRIVAAGGYDQVPEAAQRKIDEEQAGVALSYLEAARRYHPQAAAIEIEIANVHLNRRKDVAAAAASYLAASKQPDAPYFVARIYAELLRRLDRKPEAYAWLCELYPTLPKPGDPVVASEAEGDDPHAAELQAMRVELAMAPVVLDRIRELEAELGVPLAQRFRPAAGP